MTGLGKPGEFVQAVSGSKIDAATVLFPVAVADGFRALAPPDFTRTLFAGRFIGNSIVNAIFCRDFRIRGIVFGIIHDDSFYRYGVIGCHDMNIFLKFGCAPFR